MPASFLQQAGASQDQASYMSAESTPEQSGPADRQSRTQQKVPQVSPPHNRDCLSVQGLQSQAQARLPGAPSAPRPKGLKAVCDLATAGPSSQAMLVSPHHPAGTVSIFALRPRTWLAQPSAPCPGHVAPGWRNSRLSGLPSRFCGEKRENSNPPAQEDPWKATCECRPNSEAREGRCWPPGGAHQFRRHIF